MVIIFLPGYGGPHAGFFAVRDMGNLKRLMPGRMVGVTRQDSFDSSILFYGTFRQTVSFSYSKIDRLPFFLLFVYVTACLDK